MEVIKHNSGKAIGQISVRNTIATMAPSEEWVSQPGEIKLSYAQVCCSTYGAETGKQCLAGVIFAGAWWHLGTTGICAIMYLGFKAEESEDESATDGR